MPNYRVSARPLTSPRIATHENIDDSSEQHAVDPPTPDLQKDLQVGYEFYRRIAFQAVPDLRNALNIDEVAFRQMAPNVWRDSRPNFIYAVLDEVQKAGFSIHHWFERLKNEKAPSDAGDHKTRLAWQWLHDEQRFRARKLLEVLVDLICFSATNEPQYYRDYLWLLDLGATVWVLRDQEKFYGFRRRNSEYSVSETAKVIIAEEAKLDVSKRWYLKSPGPFPQSWNENGVEFSSFRNRYIRTLELALPSELVVLGKTYVHAFGGMSKGIHFTPQETSWNFDPNAIYRDFEHVGMLCFAILIRCQLLLGVVPEGANAQIREIHDEQTEPAEITAQTKQEKAAVGDFVWAHGYICEVMEIKRSQLGYVSYRLRYAQRPPIPEITEDWCAGFEIHLFVKRSAAEKKAQTLQTDPKIDAKTREHFRQMAREKPKELLDQTVAYLWQGVQQVMASHAKKQ